MSHTIVGIENAVHVTDWSIGATEVEGYGGVSGTLYQGDAELIADYITEPDGELEIFGILHHIVVRYSEDVFTLVVDSCGAEFVARFGWREARDIVFALLSVPERPTTVRRH